MHTPRTSHLEAISVIEHYVKSLTGKGILYGSHGQLNILATELQIEQI